VCAERPSQTGLVDYERFCGLAREAEEGRVEAWDVEVEDLRRWLDEGRAVTLLDVRTPEEWEIAHLPGSRLLPLHELPARLGELDREGRIVAFCHYGPRSTEATRLLRAHGYDAVNLAGGIDAWSERVDPTVPRY
jgi:adenylyltransferase/sulfurtransferase